MDDKVMDLMDTIFAMDDEKLTIVLKKLGKIYQSGKELKTLDIKDFDKEKLTSINTKINQITEYEKHLFMGMLIGLEWNGTPVLEL